MFGAEPDHGLDVFRTGHEYNSVGQLRIERRFIAPVMLADRGGSRDTLAERGFQRVEQGSGEGATDSERRDGMIHGMSPDIGVMGCWDARKLASICGVRAFYEPILR